MPLSNNIRRFLNRNKEYLEKNQNRFTLSVAGNNMQKLTTKSSQVVFNQWKKKIRANQKEDFRAAFAIRDAERQSYQLIPTRQRTRQLLKKGQIDPNRSIEEAIYEFTPIPVLPDNYQTISYTCTRLINDYFTDIKFENKQLSEKKQLTVRARMMFYTTDPEGADFQEDRVAYKWITASHYISLDDITSKLEELFNKPSGFSGALSFFFEIDILNVLKGTIGGCNANDTCPFQLPSKNDLIFVNHRAALGYNNCVFACFNSLYGQTGMTCNANKTREKLKIPLKEMIDIDQLPHILEFYNSTFNQNKGLVVINSDLEQILRYNDKDKEDDNINLLLHNEHFYTFACDNRISNLTRGQPALKKKSHEKYQKKQPQIDDPNFVSIKNLDDENELDYDDKMVFWQVESNQNNNEVKHKVLKSTIIAGGKTHIFEGDNTMKETVDLFLKMKYKTICSYYGSKKEFVFLMNELIKRNIDLQNNFLLSQGKVITLRFGKFIRVLSLDSFTQCSYEDALKEFNAKSLEDLFKTFNKTIHSQTRINISRFCSLSHLSYELWHKLDLKDIQLEKLAGDKLEFVNQAKYGARVYVKEGEYKSNNYDAVINGSMNYTQLKASLDYQFEGDVSSLYPYAMLECKMPIGLSRWSKPGEAEVDYKKGTRGIYKIRYKIPDDQPLIEIMAGIPGQLQEGIFTDITIRDAIEHGYTVVFENQALVWEQSRNIFTNFVNKFYQMKKKANNNPRLRYIAKIILNSLFGKQLQKQTTSVSSAIKSVDDFENFLFDKSITDYHIIDDDTLLISADTKIKITTTDKPIQNGVFILAYAKYYMNKFFKAVESIEYHDTDSLRVDSKDHIRLLQNDMIVSKEQAQIGNLINNLTNEALIIRAVNNGAKNYFLECIDVNNTIFKIMKMSGVPEECKREEHYSNDGKSRTIEYRAIKTNTNKVSKIDTDKGIVPFSMHNIVYKRRVNPKK